MHSSAIARRLGIRRTIVPSLFPVLSAAGLMAADIRYVSRMSADGVAVDASAGAAEQVSAGLRAAAARPLEMLARTVDGPSEVELALGLSFAGQALELTVDVRSDVLERSLSTAELRALVDRWQLRYERIYGSAAAWAEGDVAIAFYDARGLSKLEPVRVFEAPDGPPPHAAAPAPAGRRELFLGEPVDAAVYDETALRPGMRFAGPAIVGGTLRTVLVWPGDDVEIDAAGNLVVTHGAGDG
jgi:N-methylhydantoinase A